MWIPAPPPLGSAASLRTSPKSPEVPGYVPCSPEVPTRLGVSSTAQPCKRPARGSVPHGLASRLLSLYIEKSETAKLVCKSWIQYLRMDALYTGFSRATLFPRCKYEAFCLCSLPWFFLHRAMIFIREAIFFFCLWNGIGS